MSKSLKAIDSANYRLKIFKKKLGLHFEQTRDYLGYNKWEFQ